MALPTTSALESAVATIFAAANEFPTKQFTRDVVHNLNELGSRLEVMYKPDATITVAGADLAALFAGALATGTTRGVRVGTIFQVEDTTDTTDDALETAKGSAPAAGDRFVVTNVDTEAVQYIGAAPDFSDEATEEFTSIGS
tara:strand:- start:11806 stop:12231 length:426 start_codon:yes stop_codon:yes gene_type:complete